MPLLPIAEMQIDRETSRLETTKINPTRQFLSVPLDDTGHWTGSPALYQWQNGHWYDTGGQEIMNVDSIPQRFRDEIEQNPLTAGLVHGPVVTRACKFCGETMNQSEIDEHYVAHVRAAMAAAGTPPPESKSDPKPEKADANQHRRG